MLPNKIVLETISEYSKVKVTQTEKVTNNVTDKISQLDIFLNYQWKQGPRGEKMAKGRKVAKSSSNTAIMREEKKAWASFSPGDWPGEKQTATPVQKIQCIYTFSYFDEDKNQEKNKL